MKEQIVFDREEYLKKVKRVGDNLNFLYDDLHLQLNLNLKLMTEEKARKLVTQAYKEYQNFLSEFALKGEVEK